MVYRDDELVGSGRRWRPRRRGLGLGFRCGLGRGGRGRFGLRRANALTTLDHVALDRRVRRRAVLCRIVVRQTWPRRIVASLDRAEPGILDRVPGRSVEVAYESFHARKVVRTERREASRLSLGAWLRQLGGRLRPEIEPPEPGWLFVTPTRKDGAPTVGTYHDVDIRKFDFVARVADGCDTHERVWEARHHVPLPQEVLG